MIRPAWLTNGRILQFALVGLSATAIAPIAPAIWRHASTAEIRPHAPDWTLFAALAPQIKIHVAAAIGALAIGLVIWLLPKGTRPHKALGWSWVIAMTTTAISSLFITGLNGDFYSFIHLLSGWTLIALPMAIFAIRKRDVILHRRHMTGIFVGGLVIAGALSFIPGRFMFEFFF
jgi:uncharacterized membrane protein